MTYTLRHVDGTVIGEYASAREAVEANKRNLAGADLRWANLAGADLTGANLTGANLTGAYLRRAYLRRANLTGANLTGANLRRADLDEADLRCVNLAGADLHCANLRGAKLRGADLEGADLHGADLDEADLRGADLTDANLAGARNWYTSHDVCAELLLQAAGDDPDKRAVAGLVLVSRDWCWSAFAALQHPLWGWGTDVLRASAHPQDELPEQLRLPAPPAEEGENTDA